MKLSIVIPVYNEKDTILEVLDRVRRVDLPKEMIVVDDCSTDGTRQILQSLPAESDLRVILQPENRGKGPLSGQDFRPCPAISWSFRMRIWNMIRPSTPP